MPSVARSAVAPLYLFICLLLGGSAQGVWQNALLQLIGLAIICWSAIDPSLDPLPKPAKPLLALVLAAIAIVALQAIPLPPTLWDHGVRARISDGFRLLGRPLSALPISVTPYVSQSTLLCLIPPLATFCAIVRLRAYRQTWLTAALLGGTVLGVVLGALQVAGANAAARWYLYPETNLGLAVGFFANANHMATLLLMTMPFVVAAAASVSRRNLQHYSAIFIVLGAVAALLLGGIALNGSLAGYALAVPVIAATALMIMRRTRRARFWLVAGVALSALIAIAALAGSSVGPAMIGADTHTSLESREQILRTTADAISDFMPWGSGLGSFVSVYRLYESPNSVTTEYVVHAHNDYAELALELGVGGIALIVVFLAWWGRAVWIVWMHGEGGPLARAASIASAAVLIHSLVDFPLRTAAISCCFAMCLAFLSDRKDAAPTNSADLRPTRHIVIG